MIANHETINKMLYDKTTQALITELTRIYQSRPPLSQSEDKSQKIGNFDKFPRPGQHQLAGGGRGMIRARDGE